jgi:hypothetical protein
MATARPSVESRLGREDSFGWRHDVFMGTINPKMGRKSNWETGRHRARAYTFSSVQEGNA